MPERRKHPSSLIPFKDAGMLRTADFQGYTQDQIRQLERVTGAYLKYYKLPISFTNFSQAQPGIRGCVEDGIEMSYGRREVKPGDDLLLAYTKGFGLRKQRTQQANQTMEQLRQDPNATSGLAIRQRMVSSAEAEIQRPAFTTSFINSEKLAALIAVRKPLLGKLVSFAVGQAEELIPGAKDVHLTSFQQTCLVRNMLAGICIYGEPKIFLEVSDFTSNREVLIKMQDRQAVISQISKMLNIEGQEVEPYLDDLLSQISLYAASVGDLGPQPPLEQLNNAYRRLNQAFLVINPFDALINLSEEDENSIWGEQRSTVLTIHGVDYRIPWPKDLRLLAIKLESANPTRSAEARQAVVGVERLFEDYQRYQDPSQLLSLQARKEETAAQLEQENGKIIRGDIPENNQISQEDIRKLLSSEINAAYENITRLEQINPERERILRRCFEILAQIQQQTSGGKGVDFSHLLAEIETIDRSQLKFFTRTRAFLHWSVFRRFRNPWSFFHDYDTVSSVFPGLLKNESSDPFERALSCTPLDYLSYQSDLWRVRYLFQEGNIQPVGNPRFWSEILGIEERFIHQTLWNRASQYVDRHKIPFSDTYERNQIIRKLVKVETGNLLGTEQDSLVQRINKAKAYRAKLEAGMVPEDREILFSSTIKRLNDGLMALRGIISAPWGKQKDRSNVPPMVEEIAPETEEEPALKNVAGITGETSATIPENQTDYRYLLTSKVLGILVNVLPILPTSPKGIRDFVIGNYPDYFRYDQSQSAHERGRITAEYADEVRSTLGNLLADHGLSFSEKEIRKMVTWPRIASLKYNTAFYTDFASVTPQLSEWYRKQIQTLRQQKEGTYAIRKQDPDEYLASYRQASNNAESKYAAYVRTRDRALDSRLNQLRHLGFLREEVQMDTN